VGQALVCVRLHLVAGIFQRFAMPSSRRTSRPPTWITLGTMLIFLVFFGFLLRNNIKS
jgi:hypothetical protein